MIIDYTDLNQLKFVAKKILNIAQNKKIFSFYGEMGSGKTTIIAEIVKQLDSHIVAFSPTFTIINEYPTHNGDSIFHFDLYRLNSIQELTEIGFEEFLNLGKYCFIEWPEIAKPILDEYDLLKIYLKQNKNGNRFILVYV